MSYHFQVTFDISLTDSTLPENVQVIVYGSHWTATIAWFPTVNSRGPSIVLNSADMEHQSCVSVHKCKQQLQDQFLAIYLQCGMTKLL